VEFDFHDMRYGGSGDVRAKQGGGAKMNMVNDTIRWGNARIKGEQILI
jgi:hypothetical protein